MKAEWRVVPLGDVCTVVNGGTPKSNVASYWGGDVNWLTPKDMGQMTSRHIAETPRKITAKGLDNCSARLVPVGSVIMSTRAPIGHLAINDTPMAFNQGCRGMIPGANLDPVFLFHFLSANTESLNDLGTGTTFKELSATALRSFPVPLPPLDEQKQIVAVLDEAFEGLSRARANAEANLADARELFAAALRAEFVRSPDDWREVALSEIGKTVTGSTPRTSDARNLGGDLPFIKPGDFLPDGRLDYENEGLSEKGAAVSRVLPPGCALMVCIGATIGKSGYSERRIATNQQINAVVPNAGIRGEFIYLQMITPDFQREVLRNAGQATLPIINKSKWSALKVRLPRDLAWQHEITGRMRSLRDVISDLELRYSASRSELDTLHQSLLQKAFSGELT